MLETSSLRASLEEMILQQALSSPVTILDAGNCFNPLGLTRHIRRQTLQIHAVLSRIQVARAFTCFQVISLLDQTRSPAGPVFILRLLNTFTDEMVPAYERALLLARVDNHLERLRHAAPLTITIHNLQSSEELLTAWIGRLQARADKVILPDQIDQQPPAQLF